MVDYGQFHNLKPARSGVDHGLSHKVYLQVIFAFQSVRNNEVNTYTFSGVAYDGHRWKVSIFFGSVSYLFGKLCGTLFFTGWWYTYLSSILLHSSSLQDVCVQGAVGSGDTV